MGSIPVKISISGPIVIETELDELTLARLLQSLPNVELQKPQTDQKPADIMTEFYETHSYATKPERTGTTALQPTTLFRNDKSWEELELAETDIKQLYREVAPVGRKILEYVAEHNEGCTFVDMKAALVSEGDIQRKMNTIFLTARRMRYVNKQNKGLAPWDTDYPNGKPIYRMPLALAEVILELKKEAEKV